MLGLAEGEGNGRQKGAGETSGAGNGTGVLLGVMLRLVEHALMIVGRQHDSEGWLLCAPYLGPCYVSLSCTPLGCTLPH